MADPKNDATIIQEPQIINRGIINRDTGAWQEICGLYRAGGGERWLTIGNFHTLQQSDTAIIRPATDSFSNGITRAYYYIDAVSIVKVSDPIFSARDTAVCAFPATLTARAGFDAYAWSTGDTTASITVTAPGEYRVRMRFDDCGTVEDTLRVTQIPQPSLYLSDTVLCPAALPWQRTAPAGFAAYHWSNGQQGPSAQFSTAGAYALEVQTVCRTIADTFQLTVLEPVPDFSLGDSVSLCIDDRDLPQILSPGAELPVYEWSTGASSKQITVARPGLYSLRSYNACGEKQAAVAVSGCPSQLYVPNVFSPNDDGQNDRFTVFGRNIEQVTLSVYSRWGELLYQESGDALTGWDGTFRGKAADAGVYLYVLTYQMPFSAERREVRGTVTLLR